MLSIIPRKLFVSAAKRIEAYFYTSNEAKFVQASLLFTRHGLPLKHFVRQTPYFEDYSVTTGELLNSAVRDVTERVGHASLVFIEDTSIRIEAMSGSEVDVPGVRAKEWFAETSFSELDNLLIRRGNDRRTIVKSDIALHVPGLDRPLLFHGETAGAVSSAAPTFSPSPLYPWLTPDTFNGLFIPSGCDKPLGAMSLEESLPLDFRVRSLLRLLERIEEIAAGLNLPSRSYVRAEPPSVAGLLSLFPKPIYIFVGPTCAGKTTAAEVLESRRDTVRIEASNVMRELAVRHNIDATNSYRAAQRLVEVEGKEVIAREIALLVEPGRQYIVSGFRLVEEVEHMRRLFPDLVKLVYVDASERSRLARIVARGRADGVATLIDLRKRDVEQAKFGLLPLAKRFADYRIENEGTLEEFYERVISIFDGSPTEHHGKGFPNELEHEQLLRCLKVLSSTGQAMSCDEIAALSGQFGPSIRHNNANKVLKRVIGLVRRIEQPRTRVTYELLPAGEAYIRAAEAARGARV